MSTKATADIKPWQSIVNVRTALRKQGYGSPAWDNFPNMPMDRAYKTAIEQFQRDHPPLEVDGIVGPKTWAVLNGEVQAPIAPPAYSESEFRKAICDKGLELGNAGIREKKGQNRGEPFTTWNRSVFGEDPSHDTEPYCVSMWHCEIGKLAKLFGIKLALLIGASTSLLRKAAKAADRLRNLEQAEPGDLVVYPWGHTGLLLEKLPGGKIRTCEGNTSSGDTGSQNNGDGVYIRVRPAKGCGFVNVCP